MTGVAVGRIAIVVHASVPADPRIRRQADALVGAGYEVDIFALRDPGQSPEEQAGAVRVLRLPVRRRFVGFAGHLAEYVAFTGQAAVRLTAEHRRRHYRLVQVATLPDFLVFAAGPLKLAGVPLLLDLHEDMPAFFEDRFASLPGGLLRPIVGAVARGSSAMADELLTVHEPLRALAVARGTDPEKITVVMNGADERLFDPGRYPRREFMEGGQLRIVHHSALQRIYGLEVAIEAMARLSPARGDPTARLDVYGDGPYRPQIEAAIERTGTGAQVHLHGPVPLDQLPGLLAQADLGLVPSLPESYLQLSLSTKLLEYVAMGVPVIASDLATFRAHFDGAALTYVPGGDPDALAEAIRRMSADPRAASLQTAAAQRQGEPYGWSRQAPAYLAVVERLIHSAP
ncbi:MAG: glycosyltransferase family 4 protein [Chloroflexota bacterium]|nr:glycosyltransferase family 4 protein [Chloroflexota bacterium]